VFTPTPDTVAAGQVTFSWSIPSNGHTVTWDSGPGTLPVGSGTKSSGTYAATLQAGTYQYHCENHGGPGTGMHGTIIVQ
jgi:plastocyanin